MEEVSANSEEYQKSDNNNTTIENPDGLAAHTISSVSVLSKKAVDCAKSDDEKISAPDEYDTVESHDVSQNETVYQSNEKYEYGTHDSPAPTLNVPQNQGYIIQKQKTSPVLIIVIIVLALIVGVLGGMLFITMRNDKTDNSNERAPVSDVAEATAEITEAATELETQATVSATSAASTTQTTEPYVQEDVSKDEINQIYADIINKTDFLVPHRGFIIDLNNDGVNELIVPDTDTMSYIIYYYDNESLASHKFGSFMSLDNFGLYKVNGDDGTNYIYYRDNYSYKSKQGYFSLKDMTQLNIFIDYPENNGSFSADWTIDYNGTENYAKGNEPVDTFYGQPADCHTKLMSALTHYKFSISENSKYTAITGMYKDELLENLSNNGSIAPKATASLSLRASTH